MSTDLTSATDHLAALVAGVGDDQLGDPTPCPGYAVGDLLDHIGGLALAFRWAADKDLSQDLGVPADGDAANLGADWRESIPVALADLAVAWRAPEAWDGMTRAGGMDMPGEIAGSVAAEEVVVHGWDLARATGQPFSADEPSLEAALAFLGSFPDEAREPGFGPAVPVPEDAPLVDRVVGAAGRDPGWAP